MPKFNVHVSRTVFQNVSIEVEAENEDDAETLALEQAEAVPDHDWGDGEIENYYVSEVEDA